MSESDQLYSKASKDFTRTVKRAFEASISAKGIDAGDQRYWASLLLTRACGLCTSILLICPRSVLNERGLSWDFESVAALSRSLFETILMLFYLGIETLSVEEWKARINLVHLADCTERIRLFYGLGNDDMVAGFVGTAVYLRARLEQNAVIQELSISRRKQILSGERPTLFGKGEIIKRLNEDPERTLNFYRFLSNYVHSFPTGFHRTDLHKRVGTENDVDKANIGMALEFAASWLEKVVERFEGTFADLVIFGKDSFDFGVLTLPSSSFTARDEILIRKAFSSSITSGFK